MAIKAMLSYPFRFALLGHLLPRVPSRLVRTAMYNELLARSVDSSRVCKSQRRLPTQEERRQYSLNGLVRHNSSHHNAKKSEELQSSSHKGQVGWVVDGIKDGIKVDDELALASLASSLPRFAMSQHFIPNLRIVDVRTPPVHTGWYSLNYKRGDA